MILFIFYMEFYQNEEHLGLGFIIMQLLFDESENNI